MTYSDSSGGQPNREPLRSVIDARIDIRIATPDDAGLLADLGSRTFGDAFGQQNAESDMKAYLASAFGERIQAEEIADERSVFLVAEVAGETTGYARLRRSDAPPAIPGQRPIEIVRFYSEQAWIGRGVGPALMAKCLELAASMGGDVVWLSTWDRNARALAFYEKWGFMRVGGQQFHVGDDVQSDHLLARAVD